jgi:hypothetical protein
VDLRHVATTSHGELSYVDVFLTVCFEIVSPRGTVSFGADSLIGYE